MDICIDFDGTCVTHEFPAIGKDIGAVPVLKRLVENGHRLILFTMRSNVENNTGYSKEAPEIHNGKFLDEALNWFDNNEIRLFGINENPEQKEWTVSPKAYGQLYIDDAALGAPVKIDTLKAKKPFIDWPKVELDLALMGYFGVEAATKAYIALRALGKK